MAFACLIALVLPDRCTQVVHPEKHSDGQLERAGHGPDLLPTMPPSCPTLDAPILRGDPRDAARQPYRRMCDATAERVEADASPLLAQLGGLGYAPAALLCVCLLGGGLAA